MSTPAPPPRFKPHEAEYLADFAQFVINSRDANELKICPWPIDAGPQTSLHREVCQICRVRDLLTPGWFLKPETRVDTTTPESPRVELSRLKAALKTFAGQLVAGQRDLPPEAAKVLYDNLCDLYDDGTHPVADSAEILSSEREQTNGPRD